MLFALVLLFNCLFLFQTKYEEAKKAIAAKGKPLQQKVSLSSPCHLPRGWRFSRVLAYSLALMKLRDYSWFDFTKNPLFPPRVTFLACGNFHAHSSIRSPWCNSHSFILLLSANLAVLHWCSDFSHGAGIPECKDDYGTQNLEQHKVQMTRKVSCLFVFCFHPWN